MASTGQQSPRKVHSGVGPGHRSWLAESHSSREAREVSALRSARAWPIRARLSPQAIARAGSMINELREHKCRHHLKAAEATAVSIAADERNAP
jgi:hypothetical protein